jgi:hypothetical protein
MLNCRNKAREGDINMEKAVTRLNNGKVLKGYLKEFSPDQDEVILEEELNGVPQPVKIEDVKAVFFVRSFEGDREYKEKKSYGFARVKGQRVFVKFRDGEGLVGFLEGKVPWKRGFFLSKKDSDLKGFYLLPADEDANNIKIFVVYSSVADVTIVPSQVNRS